MKDKILKHIDREALRRFPVLSESVGEDVNGNEISTDLNAPERITWTEGAKYGYNIKESVDKCSCCHEVINGQSFCIDCFKNNIRESVDVDWKKLRDEYFDEHVRLDTGCYIHITTSAHDLFEWFKSKLSASKNTVSNEGEWVSVDDRLPEAYKTIISYNIRTDEVSTDYIDDEKRWDVLNPTHWMPLPQPPKEK